MNINEIAQVNYFHATRLGHITHPQVPIELKETAQIFNSKTLDLDEMLNMSQEIKSSTYQLITFCDGIVELL